MITIIFSFSNHIFKSFTGNLQFLTEKIFKPLFFNNVFNLFSFKNWFNPFPGQILDSSKLKVLADDNFKFDENCIKFYK